MIFCMFQSEYVHYFPKDAPAIAMAALQYDLPYEEGYEGSL